MSFPMLTGLTTEIIRMHDPLLFHAFDATPYSCRRKIDRLTNSSLRGPVILLQDAKYLQIETIQCRAENYAIVLTTHTHNQKSKHLLSFF